MELLPLPWGGGQLIEIASNFDTRKYTYEEEQALLKQCDLLLFSIISVINNDNTYYPSVLLPREIVDFSFTDINGSKMPVEIDDELASNLGINGTIFFELQIFRDLDSNTISIGIINDQGITFDNIMVLFYGIKLN